MQAITVAEAKSQKSSNHAELVQKGLDELSKNINRQLIKGDRAYTIYRHDHEEWLAINDKDGAQALEDIYRNAGWELELRRISDSDLVLFFNEGAQL
jgi:hypothetical protein